MERNKRLIGVSVSLYRFLFDEEVCNFLESRKTLQKQVVSETPA